MERENVLSINGREGLQPMLKIFRYPQEAHRRNNLLQSALMAFLIGFAQTSFASTDLLQIWQNNQAVDYLLQKKALESHEEFTGLLTEHPYHPLYNFNAGASFFVTEEPEKALKMYKQTLKLKPLPPKLEFATLFNLGVLNASKPINDIDKALSYYQRALDLVPDSKEVKTNIELLFKGGGGKGKSDKKDKNQDKKDKGEEQPQEPQEFTNKPQPDQFKSKEMSKNDVKKILEELKKQEQRIRAKHERKGKKRADNDKNW